MMKICAEVDKELASEAEIITDIRRFWPQVEILSNDNDILPRETEGLLVVGRESNRPKDSLLTLESVDPEGLTVEQIMFLVNAHLGKMLSSDLLKRKVTSHARDNDFQISRRDLLAGIRSIGVFQTHSDAPIIQSSICEAKFGCSKCIDACPVQALSVINGSLSLKEDICDRSGFCVAACSVAAIQLPSFSESGFLGLVYGITRAGPDIPKTLVLTCDSGSISKAPWMHVEQIKDIGLIGPRHLAIAASSGIDNIIVHCADGACLGKQRARDAVESMRNFLGSTSESEVAVKFLEGTAANEEIQKISLVPGAKARTAFVLGRIAWDNYVHALESLTSGEAATPGLGLTKLDVSETCTLCEVCSRYCPHSALVVSSGSLQFDSSRCTGCGYCAEICPEHSITLNQLERFSEIKQRTIFRDEIVNCARCGRPLGSSKYLKRIATLLDKPNPMLKYCDMCKQHLAMERLLGKE